MRRIIIFILLLFLVCDVYVGNGTTGAVFLKDPVGARPLGMGGAFVAVSDDVNAIYSNPGGIHYVAYPGISTMYRKGLLDTYFGYVGGVCPLREFGTISASFLLFDGGDIDASYSDGTNEKVKAEQDMAFTVGYGRNFGELVFTGANLKLVRNTLLGRYTATAYAVDVGSIYRTLDEKLSIGFVVNNIGSGLQYISVSDPLPLSAKLGLAYKILNTNIHEILVAGDLIYGINDRTIRTNMGVEYLFLNTVALRLGERLGYDLNGLTAGVGVKAFGWELDYGYALVLDEMSHRVSLTYNIDFSGSSKDKAAKYKEKGLYKRARYIDSK